MQREYATHQLILYPKYTLPYIREAYFSWTDLPIPVVVDTGAAEGEGYNLVSETETEYLDSRMISRQMNSECDQLPDPFDIIGVGICS